MCRLDERSTITHTTRTRTLIDAYSVHDAYAIALESVKALGDEVTARSKKTLNLHGVSIDLHPTIDEKRNISYFQKRVFCKNRNLTNKTQDSEFAWFMTHNNSLEPIEKYNKNWIKYSDNGKTVNSNYGSIWKSQIYGIMKKMCFDKYTRQAVIQIYDGDMSNNFVTKDVQCCKSIDFKIVPNSFGEDELHMTVDMRSNDVIYGLPIDMFVFASLHELVYNEVSLYHEDLRLGVYTHNATSMHVYEKDYDLMMLGIEMMSEERMNEKTKFPFIQNKTLYSTFWYSQDQHFFERLDVKDFVNFVHNGSMFLPFVDAHAIVDDIMANEFGRYTSNEFTVESIMPLVTRTIEIFNKFEISYPCKDMTDEEIFDRFYYCKNYVGNTIMSTTFITNVLLTTGENFMRFHDTIRSYTDFIRPITKFDVCIAVLNSNYNKK